jgi:hypothetical protein
VGAQLVGRRQSGSVQPGTIKVGVGHAERLEDVRTQVSGEGHPGHVLDDLAQGGEPVVGEHEPGARLGVDTEAAPVELGEGRPRPSGLHCFAQVSHPQQAR